MLRESSGTERSGATGFAMSRMPPFGVLLLACAVALPDATPTDAAVPARNCVNPPPPDTGAPHREIKFPILDALTGPEGLPNAEYKKLFDYAADIDFGF